MVNSHQSMTPTEPKLTDDNLLLEQVSCGNKKSFDILFDRYWESSLDSAYKRTKDLDAAKDIVQEIFTQIWINRETQIDNLPAYLNVSIRNRVIKFFAKQKPIHPFFDALDNISERSSQADTQLLWKEFLRSYEHLLDSLPPKRRDIFRLRMQDGLSTKVIAITIRHSEEDRTKPIGQSNRNSKGFTNTPFYNWDTARDFSLLIIFLKNFSSAWDFFAFSGHVYKLIALST